MPGHSSHRAILFPPCLTGVEAVSLVSDRSFPRHSHDQFGLGVVRAGGHASWSGGGPVEAGPGDVIAVSPEEMHDGAPIGGARAWDILYVAPETGGTTTVPFPRSHAGCGTASPIGPMRRPRSTRSRR